MQREQISISVQLTTLQSRQASRVRALVIDVAGDITRGRLCFTWLYRHHNALKRSSDPSFALTTTSTDATLRISISPGRPESPLGVGSTEQACCSMLQTDAVSQRTVTASTLPRDAHEPVRGRNTFACRTAARRHGVDHRSEEDTNGARLRNLGRALAFPSGAT